ncbi:protein of unknown function [Chryseolinea serpens]|uniref:DUF4412 domain-containing protein n=1 Tax=Chryseolinea serpens TaxID=947013 RepID=A0A1M5QKQ1_9BACT|nr:DUF4412 domain-containing protein [Chryseolinea serpens]SHH14578.1 protein of unknown function [Chryseolinea serpens]
MKKTLILLLLLTVTLTHHIHAQSWEGIINWTMKMEITDPQMKAQMDAAQKQMSDPATQAKMKEMQAKMDDPQFKAMMESNPQMKAQIENMLKAAQGGNLNSMFPKGMQIKVKNNNSITKMDGGMMSNWEVLHLTDKNTTYRLDRENKTFSVMPQYTADKDKEKVDYKVTKTSETTKILGYTCTKYAVESTSKDPEAKKYAMTQFFWTTTDIKGIDLKSLSKQRMGNSQQSLFYEQIEGVPLKIEMNMPQGHMAMEVTELKKQSLPASDFEVPAGYKEVKSAF